MMSRAEKWRKMWYKPKEYSGEVGKDVKKVMAVYNSFHMVTPRRDGCYGEYIYFE